MIQSVNKYHIYEILSADGNFYYTIPKYQRENTWGYQQWEALYDADQKKIADNVVKNGLSVRATEKLVKEYFIPPEEKKKKSAMPLSNELKELIGDMQRVFGTKVNAIGNDNKGRIYIDYYTRDDLDRLSEMVETLKSKHF